MAPPQQAGAGQAVDMTDIQRRDIPIFKYRSCIYILRHNAVALSACQRLNESEHPSVIDQPLMFLKTLEMH